MSMKFSEALRDARATQIINALDADATNPGYIEFYTSPQPGAAGDAITTQTLLGACTLSKPSGTVSGGVITFATIADDTNADAGGDIAWARFYDGGGAFVMDADCGVTGSGAALEFNTLTVQAGGIIQVLSGSITEGNA